MDDKKGRPSLIYALICEDVRLEVNDKVSLMGLFDAIYAERFPAIHPRLAIVAGWTGAIGEFKSEILFASPDGSEVLPLGTVNFKLLDETKTHRHVAISFNLNLKTPGVYQARILLDGTLMRTIPLNVLRFEKPSPAN